MKDITCEGCACDCSNCDEKGTVKVCVIVVAALLAIVISFAVGFAVGVVK